MSHSVIHRLLQHAQCTPDAPAIYWRQGTLSYQQLTEKVIRLAVVFRQITRSGPIAVHLSRTPDLIATLLAAWYSGRAFVALDPKHPPHRRQTIIAESQPAALVYDISPPVNMGDYWQWHINELETSQASTHGVLPATPGEEDTAYLLYTSGSTGKPKGIAIGHQSVQALIDWALEHYSVQQLHCVLASTTITFDLSVFEIFTPLSAGQALYLADSVLDLLEPERDFSAITLINTVPSAARELVRAGAIPVGVNTVNLAGEALHWTLVNQIYQHSQVESVCNLWGPSEDTTYSTLFCSQRHESERPHTGAVPIGIPLPGTSVFIMDEQLCPVAPGQQGEICLAGAGLAKGYHNNPELTAERFPSVTMADGERCRLYRTGDWGHQTPDGVLHFHGRMDFQVKIRGHRIELEEPEQALLMLDAVREAAVIVQEQQEQQHLVAIVVKSREEQPDEQLLQCCQQHLHALLPAWMMPHRWQVYPGALPRTTSGKICRRTLTTWNAESTESTTPTSPILSIIAEVLGYQPETNIAFAAAGGDSLSAVRLQTLLRQRLGKHLDLTHILSPVVSLSVLCQQAEAQPETKEQAESSLAPVDGQRLTAMEYRMYKIYKAHRAAGSYNIGLILDFDQALDIARLKYAVMTALSQSRALHSCIAPDAQGASYCPVSDESVWHQLPASELTTSQRHAFFAQPFNLEQSAPIQVLCVDEPQGGGSLLLSIAHTAIDGVGLRTLLQYIAALYQGQCDGASGLRQPSSPSETRQQAALNYWQRELRDFNSLPPWPEGIDNQPDGTICQTLSADQKQQLHKLCRNEGITLPVMLLATLFTALQRLSGCQDLIIATPVANRQQEQQPQITNTTNSLPLRCRLREESHMQEVIAQVQQQLVGGLQWQDIATDWVAENLPDELNKEALFDTIFSYMDFLQGAFSLPGVSTSVDFFQPATAKAPLVVSAIVTEQGALRMVFEYQGDKLYPAWVDTLAQLFAHLLEQWSVIKSLSLGQISPVPPRQHALLRSLETVQPQQTAASLVEWLNEAATQFPAHIAIQDGETAITYARLWTEAECLAANLQARGVVTGDVVGVHMEKGWRLIATLCAVLRAGAGYVPLDPRNPDERNHYIARRSGLRLAIKGRHPLSADFPVVDYDTLATPGPVFTPVHISPDALAYIIFTSGTTGQPKGVPITHRNVCRLFTACQSWGEFSERDSWTLFHSYAFDFSVWEIFGALLHGGRLVIVPPESATDMVRFAALLEQQHVSVLSLTPTAFRNFTGSTAMTLDYRPRLVVFGGEALRPADLQSWWQHYGVKETRFINMYGITEITVHATMHEMSPDDRLSVIGRPLADIGILLRDKRGLICPPGVPGEMCISGEGVTQGYCSDPELNQQRFGVLKGLESAQRYYFSGDLAVVNHRGQLCYLGREDKQVKINGHRVELDEISGALRQIVGISASVVRVITIDNTTRMLVAWFVSDQAMSPDTLMKQLSRSLPIWAIPEKLIRIPELPLTVNGKIDENCLPDPLVQAESAELKDQHAVQQIWQHILGYERLPDDLPFFAAGGTSIKAALLVQHLNQLLEEPALSLIDIFRHPCIRDQQQLIDQLLTGETI